MVAAPSMITVTLPWGRAMTVLAMNCEAALELQTHWMNCEAALKLPTHWMNCEAALELPTLESEQVIQS